MVFLVSCLMTGCATTKVQPPAVAPAAEVQSPQSQAQPPVSEVKSPGATAPAPVAAKVTRPIARATSSDRAKTVKAATKAAAKNPLESFFAAKAAAKVAAKVADDASPTAAKAKTAAEPRVHVELAFDNADLYEVLDATLFDLFKVDYMVNPSIKAKVTFHVEGNYTRDQFINILNNVLQLSNLAITKGIGGIYKIVQRVTSAGMGGAPLVQGSVPNAAGDITRMIRLRYISAGTALANIRPFLSPGAVAVTAPVNNSLVITDTPENIAKAVGILGVLDEQFFKNIAWRVFPVHEVSADEIAKDLTQVLKTGGLFNRPGMNPGSYDIVPIKSMNAILVVSRWPALIKLVEAWLGAMDHAPNSGNHVFVYFVENGSAKDLADVLRQLYGGSPSEKKTTIVNAVAGARKTPTTATAASPISGEKLSGNVDIIADETNNAIIFKGTDRDYQTVKRVLEKLDIVPRQVLIDVVVAEITLSSQTQFGVEWFLQGFTNNHYTVQGALDNKVGHPINTALGSTAGFTLGVYDPTSFLRGLVSVLGSSSDVNILSAPNVLAVDNKEATINVGTKIPTVTGQVTDLTSSTTLTNTVQYQNTGIILKVTPHINSSGLVKMNISQEVSEQGSYYPALQTYSILERKVDTSLVAQNGQTVVIGGLITKQQTKSNSGIPLLKDIPLLGTMFKNKNSEMDKTELILLITPHVITNQAEAEQITKEFSSRVDHLKELIGTRTE